MSFSISKEQLEIFYRELDTQNSWGKNQLKQMLLEVIAGIRK